MAHSKRETGSTIEVVRRAEEERSVGRLWWAIAEGYIPAESTGPEREMQSHETVCVLNANDQEAHVRITIYFSDQEPLGPYLLNVGPRRTKHVRFNNLNDPARFLGAKTIQVLSSPTSPSWCSTYDSTRAKQRMLC